MTFLTLQPLSLALLPAALELDQRCFGGLWTLDGYRRELESPNSELLVLAKESDFPEGQPTGVRSQESGAEEQDHFNANLSSNAAQSTTQNSKLKTQNSPLPSPLSPHSSPLLGLGCYWAILEEAHITLLAIDPTYQRQGLGQALLYALMLSAHQRGLERATLEVRISNQSAIALYKKFDFREAGQRRRYYPDNSEDALVLWRGGLQAPEFPERLTDWQQQICDRLHRTDWQLDRSSDCSLG